jgi:hypothetical protein
LTRGAKVDIDSTDNTGKSPKLRSINEEFEVTADSIIIKERNMPQELVGRVKFSEIDNIEIKAAGTLFDGHVIFNLKKGGSIKFGIKKYQQEDFEHLKASLKK